MMKIIKIVFFCSILIQGVVFANTSEKLFEKGRLHSFQAWGENNNIYHFKKAINYYNKAKEIIIKNKSSYSKEKFSLLTNKINQEIIINQNRINAFKNTVRNQFPLIPSLLGGYSHQNEFISSENLAFQNSLDRLIKSTFQFTRRKGQLPFIVLTHKDISKTSYEYIVSNLQNHDSLGIIYPEEFISSFSNNKIPNFNQIKNYPILLKNLLNKIKKDEIIIFYFKKINKDNNIVLLKSESWHLSAKNNYSIKNIIRYLGFGQNINQEVESAENSLINLVGISLFFILLLSFILINFIKKVDFHERLKMFFFFLVLFFLGIIIGYVPDFTIDMLFPNWNEMAEDYIKFAYLFGLLIGLVEIIVGALLLIKAESIAVLSNHKGYLPSAFTSFSLGISIWFIFEINYYSGIYPLSEINNSFYLLIFILASSGFIKGQSIRQIIRKSELTTFNLVFSVFILIYSLIIDSLIFSKYLSLKFINLEYILGINLVLIFSFEILSKFISKIISNENNKNLIIHNISPPNSLDSLKKSLKNPIYINVKNNSKEKALIMLRECFKEEGGILHIHGINGAGKLRFVNELLEENELQNTRIIRLKCLIPEPDSTPIPFLPFIKGLGNLPEVKQLESTLKMGDQLQSATLNLADPVSSIPVLGSILQAFLQTDTSDVILKSNIKNIEKDLAIAIDKFSISLANKSKEKHNDVSAGKLIFIVEDYQFIDEASKKLIFQLQKYLKDDNISPEHNDVAIIIINSKIDNNKKLIEDSLLINDSIKNIEVLGLSISESEQLFYQSLNFSQLSKKLFLKLVERSKNNDSILPKTFLENINSIIEEGYLEYTNRGFVLMNNIDINSLPIPNNINENYNIKINTLPEKHQILLECASLIGVEFSAEVLSNVIDKDYLIILQDLHSIQNNSDLIVDQFAEKDYFVFKDAIIAHILQNKLSFVELKNKKSIVRKKQLYLEYQKRIFSYYEKEYKITENPQLLIPLANHSYLAGSNFLKNSIEYNLKASELMLNQGQVNHSAELLNKALDSINLEKKTRIEKIDSIIHVLSKILQNLREHVLNDYLSIKSFVWFLYDYIKQYNFSDELNMDLAEIAYIVSIVKDNNNNFTLEDCISYSNKVINSTDNDFLKSTAIFWKVNAEKILTRNQNNDLLKINEIILDCEKGIDLLNNLENNDKEDLLSKLLNTKAELFIKINKENEAIVIFNEAFIIKDKINDNQGKAMILSWLYSLYVKEDNYSEAMKSAKDMLELNLKMENHFGIDLSYTALAEIFELKAKKENNETYYIESINNYYNALIDYTDLPNRRLNHLIHIFNNISLLKNNKIEKHKINYFEKQIFEFNLSNKNIIKKNRIAVEELLNNVENNSNEYTEINNSIFNMLKK